MKPGKIEGATRMLGAPKGWDEKRDGQCDALPIRDVAIKPGEAVTEHLCMQSAWVPTEDEKRLIAEGRPVILTIWGWRGGHPPVSVGVE